MGRILDWDSLRLSLTYVAILAAVADLPRKAKDFNLQPWDSMADVVGYVDGHLLAEELLCAASQEHALVSAALVLDYAVRGRSSKYGATTASAMQTLWGQMTGPDATDAGRELAAILQAMALHDRRPAVELHRGAWRPRDVPRPLDFERFPVPGIVSVADELQEWGRTLGPLEGIGAVDAEIDVSPPTVSARFSLSPDEELFSDTPFSLLEYMLGKYKTVGRFRATGEAGLSLAMELADLDAFALRHVARGNLCRFEFSEGFERLAFGGIDLSDEARVVNCDAGMEVLSIGATGSSKRRDFLVLSGDQRLVGAIREHAASCPVLAKLRLAEGKMTLTLSDDIEIGGAMIAYRFGELSPSSVPSDKLPVNKKCAVLQVELIEETKAQPLVPAMVLEPQAVPFGHFLDYDWRFTARTCRALVEVAKRLADEHLGPSAIWAVQAWHCGTNACIRRIPTGSCGTADISR